MTITIELNDLANLQNENTAITQINQNSETIEGGFTTALNTTGDKMQGTLDMNSNQIINLSAPATGNSPVRLVDVASPTSVINASLGTITTLSNLVSVGTITTGTWNATTVGVAHGGTGDTGTPWSSYTPTAAVAATTGSAIATCVGQYKTIGKTCFLQVQAVMSGSFTGGTVTSITLPVASNTTSGSIWILAGRENAITGLLWQGIITSSVTSLLPFTYSNLNSITTGSAIYFSGVYETA